MPDLDMYTNKHINGRYKSTGKRISEIKYRSKKPISNSISKNGKLNSPSYLRVKNNLNLAAEHL